MVRYFIRLAALAVLSATAIVAPAVGSAAAPGTGTFTTVTSPAKTLTYHYAIGGTNHLHVSGRTSLDVTEVDIDCITYVFDGQPDIQPMASAVPVSGGSFSVTAAFPSTPARTAVAAVGGVLWARAGTDPGAGRTAPTSAAASAQRVPCMFALPLSSPPR